MFRYQRLSTPVDRAFPLTPTVTSSVQDARIPRCTLLPQPAVGLPSRRSSGFIESERDAGRRYQTSRRGQLAERTRRMCHTSRHVSAGGGTGPAFLGSPLTDGGCCDGLRELWIGGGD